MKKLGGWHRFWIFLSVIYLFLVIGVTIYFYVQETDENRKEWAQETIRLALPQYKEQHIKSVMTDIKELLRNYDSNSKTYFKLKKNAGIDLIFSKEKLFVSIKYEIYIPRTFFNSSQTIAQEKKIEFPTNANPTIVIDEVGKAYGEIINQKWNVSYVRNNILGSLKDNEIINVFHKKNENIVDFSSIDSKYQEQKIRILFLSIFYAFAFWIVPVIIVYILGFSIGWVIRGFRKK